MLTLKRAGELFGLDLQEAIDLVGGLSPREGEICAMIAAGWTASQIAAALGLSPITINGHRFRIKRRLGVTDNSISRWFWAARVGLEILAANAYARRRAEKAGEPRTMADDEPHAAEECHP